MQSIVTLAATHAAPPATAASAAAAPMASARMCAELAMLADEKGDGADAIERALSSWRKAHPGEEDPKTDTRVHKALEANC